MFNICEDCLGSDETRSPNLFSRHALNFTFPRRSRVDIKERSILALPPLCLDLLEGEKCAEIWEGLKQQKQKRVSCLGGLLGQEVAMVRAYGLNGKLIFCVQTQI